MEKRYPYRSRVRWVFLCLLMITLNSQAENLYDTSNITLHVTNQPIENIFKLIEKQTGLTFYYGSSILDGSKPASIKVEKASLAEVMNQLLKGKNVSWRVKDNGIVLSKAPAVPALTTSIDPTDIDTVPSIDVSGRVIDKTGRPIVAASVTIKGQLRGQGSDTGGNFRFTNIPRNATIIVSSLGFDSKQMKVAGRSYLQVTLDSAIKEISAVEVVSTGYQSLPRERVTGSFVQLDNALINRTVSANILDKIMDVSSSLRRENTGDNSITIRGYSTISSNTYPLIVIDGFPYEEPLNQGIHVLDNLNPNDVESITILRDAAAASIWGARSGNGVIVITTKKGSFNRRLNVQFNANVNIIEKPRLNTANIISSADAVEFERIQFAKGTFNIYDDIYPSVNFFPILPPATEILLAQRRGALTSQQAEEKLQELSQHDVRDDIKKYLVQPAISQQYNINVSGGSDKVSYYGSIGYDRQQPNIKNNSSNRTTIRIDNTFKPIRKMELRTFISYVQSSGHSNGVDYLPFIANGRSAAAAPYVMLADNTGNPLSTPYPAGYRSAFVDTANYPGLLDWRYIPLEEPKFVDNTYKQFDTRVGASLRVSVIEGLDIELKGQYESRTDHNSRYSSLQSYQTRTLINSFMQVDNRGNPQYPVPLGGILDYGLSEIVNWNSRIQLNYTKDFMDHQITAIGGYETSESKLDYNTNRKYGYNPDNEQFVQNMDFNTSFLKRPLGNQGTGKIPVNALVSGTLNRTLSYFGNAAYTFNNKYSATISGRIDASNFIGSKANQRRIPLWSAGLGWAISNEKFYNFQAIPFLKLRATYGYNGNLNNKATPLPIARYNPPDGTYHNEPYLGLASPPNPGLTWEKVKMINIGVDFQSKNNRINGSIEYYTKRGINLIGPLQIEYTTGVAMYVTNFGSIKGKGIDLMLETTPLTKGLIWKNSFRLSYNNDKVLDYPRGNLPNLDGYMSSPYVIGKSLRTIYSIPSAGLDPTNGNPRGFLKGEAVDFNTYLQGATSEDVIFNGSSVPLLFGNMLNTFTYKSLSISFNITGSFKYYFRRKSVNYSDLFQNWGTHSDYAKRWQKPGDEANTSVPSLPQSPDQRDYFYRNTNTLVERGDHIRLQDVRIAYSFGSAITSRLKISGLSVFANANNLGVIWRANNAGIDPYYPNNDILPSKAIAAGLTVGF